MTTPLTRRGFLAVSGGAAAGLALPGIGHAGLVVAAPGEATENAEASAYYRLLLKHTRFVESLWDEDAGHYPLEFFYFVNVTGNAVLLRHGEFDEELAGVSREVLHDHTVRTIEHFAATNFFAVGATWDDGTYEWGGRIYWDATMESYFVAAAKLMWDDLTQPTRDDVDAIAVGGAEYVVGLRDTEDPRSGGWSSNGLLGGYRGDSKIEEMGAKSMPIATGLAYFPDHPSAALWRDWLTRWMSNMTGLPAADATDQTLLEGRPVSSWNTAQNLYPTYLVENHGPYAPMYQESVGAYPGRNAIHFLIAGQPLLDVFGYQPNADGLWRTLRHLGTNSGLTSHPMVADRYHLYGRDVLPLTWRRMGQADRFLARSEQKLLAHLEPYLDYPPAGMLTKFSGEPKYEPEARAEVAIAYLLHLWRDRLHGDVVPVTEQSYWADVAGVTDYGADVGLVAHQGAAALSMIVTKPGWVKFAYLPEHDDWLFDVAGASPGFLPSTQVAVQARTTKIYAADADGFDASATVLAVPTGHAGFTTLPTGAVVYATTGTAAGEGALRLHAFDMPGVEGLDGDRTFHSEDGAVTLAAAGGDGGVDELSFAPVQARHVRMLGGRPGSQYGYSLWSFEVFATGTDADLCAGRPTTASSHDPGYLPAYATDSDPATRWAVARAERPRPDSWLAVDLGAVHELDRARLSWDPAFGAEYRVQVSLDGSTWTDAVAVPQAHTIATGWVNLEDRAGFVVRGSTNPIRVTATSMTLSAGPAEGSRGMVVQAFAGLDAAATAEQAAAPAPVVSTEAFAAAVSDGYLSVFNLSAAAAEGSVTLAVADSAVLVSGTQRLGRDAQVIDVRLEAAAAVVLRPLFAVDGLRRGPDETALAVVADAVDPGRLDLANEGTTTVMLSVRSLSSPRRRPVRLRPGASTTLRF